MSDEDRKFSFRPAFEGVLTLERIPEDWSDRMQRRIDRGLILPGSRNRARYRVESADRDLLTFDAVDWRTAYAIGLNHVELQREGTDTITYRVSFTRWNRIAVAHGALIGIILAAGALLQPKLRAQMDSYPFGPWLFGGLVAFFSLAWPWILTAIQRNSARNLLEDVVLEELEEDEPEARAVS